MTPQNFSAFLFDDVRVEPATFRAFKAGNAIQLEPKALRLLLFLIENRGRLIEKREILETIWNGTYVTENALAREIAKLRKTLGDDPKAARYIQTVHTRGYRFIAEVELGNGQLSHDRETGPVEHLEEFETVEPTAGALDIPLPKPNIRERRNPTRFLSTRSAWTTIVLIAGLTFSIPLGIYLWTRRVNTDVVLPNIGTTSVAVLPFKSTGPAADDQYLGIEIADALTAKLNNSKRLSVRPVTTVLHFAGTGDSPNDVTAIGARLKVDYVLSGAIDKTRQRMTTSLVRVRDGAPLFAETYDEKFDDIFQLEDSLIAKVLSNLLVNLEHEETQRTRKRFTENHRAYEKFLKAHYFMNQSTKNDLQKGIAYFQQALDLDPKYAMAYAGLSDSYMRLGRHGVPPAEFIPKSRAAVIKALELDDTVAYSHSMLGRIAFMYDWDFARAEREYARARELEPNLVHAWYAAYLLTRNRPAEAESEYRRFEEFLPFLPANLNLGQYFYLTGQHDAAVDHFTTKLEMNPSYPLSHEWLGLVYEQQGRHSQAIEEFQNAIRLSGGHHGVGALGHLYASLGKSSEARKAIREIEERSKRSYVSPYEKAVIHAGLGESEQVLKNLQKSFDERSLSGPMLRFDPRLNGLRSDPRFQDFMRRVGLKP